jgi:hypothetical protein
MFSMKGKKLRVIATRERMRRYRQRRRDGLRCVMIDLRETEIDALIDKGFLASERRNEPDALGDAMHDFLDSIFSTQDDASHN